MQQTFTHEITYPRTSKFDNLRSLVHTNKHDSNDLRENKMPNDLNGHLNIQDYKRRENK